MSIQNNNRVAGPYHGNDSTSVFPFKFKVFADGELRVVKTETDKDKVEYDLTLGTHYTVKMNVDQDSSPGGSIIITPPPKINEDITVTSKLLNIQPETLTNQGGFYPKVIEYALDRLTIMIQQVGEHLNRCITVGIGYPKEIDLTLPRPKAGAGLGWSADGKGLVNDPADFAGTVAVTKGYATAAKASETKAATSATNAKTSETNAKTSADAAAGSATAAARSATSAQADADRAHARATSAETIYTTLYPALGPVERIRRDLLGQVVQMQYLRGLFHGDAVILPTPQYYP